MRFFPLLLIASLVSCQQVSHRAPPGLSHAAPTLCRPSSAWEVVHAGSVVGVVVQFSDLQEASRRFFSVRNAHQQELGLVDALGRAWRFRPHGADAECLGSGSMLSGAARILGVDGACQLFEVPLEALEAEASEVQAFGGTPQPPAHRATLERA